MITYDKNGTIDAKIAKGEYKEDQSIEMRKVIGNMDDSEYDNIFSRLETSMIWNGRRTEPISTQ